MENIASLGLIGFFILLGGAIKRIYDPVKKKEVKTYYIGACICAGILLLLAYFPKGKS